jgi:acetoin utilization deacetylase AcuC-like enzyme
MCNVPLAAGCGGEEFRDAVLQVWMPRLKEFKPQMILISAGFDGHYEDDMGGLKLLEKDFAWCTDHPEEAGCRNVRQAYRLDA